MKSPIYKHNPNYITELVINRTLYIQFVIPSKFLLDADHFINGKYSVMSKGAKSLIYSTSSLPYNSTMGSFSISHPVLQALDRTKTLRSYLSNMVGQELEGVELMESPSDDWFIETQIT